MSNLLFIGNLGTGELLVIAVSFSLLLLLALAFRNFGWARICLHGKGIIISAILGLLVLYLVCCFFGLMGEEQKNKILTFYTRDFLI